MILLFSLIVIAVVAFFQYRNGLFTSVAMLIQVILAGLIAFGFWEPVADELDEYFRDGKLAGYEDAIVLTALFCLALLGLRVITNKLNKSMIDFNMVVQQIGGPVVGAITGYFVSGFLICVFQTLPIEEDFGGFTPRKAEEPGLRSYFPADRVWLAMMRHAGAFPLSWKEGEQNSENPFERTVSFDRYGTFELRYLRYRRHSDRRPQPMRYEGEFEKELGRNQG
jgi:Colicin V production protein